MHTSSSYCILIISYRAGNGRSSLRGAGADRSGVGRGARGAAAPGGAVVQGATARVRQRPGGHRRADH